MLSLPRALCWVLICLISCIEAAKVFGPSDFPSQIRLNAAVVHAPPFAYIEYEGSTEKPIFPGEGSSTTGNPTYRGFMIDLLDHLQEFALEDNVDLQVDLTEAPTLYGDAFDMVANDCNSTGSRRCNHVDLIVGESPSLTVLLVKCMAANPFVLNVNINSTQKVTIIPTRKGPCEQI